MDLSLLRTTDLTMFPGYHWLVKFFHRATTPLPTGRADSSSQRQIRGCANHRYCWAVHFHDPVKASERDGSRNRRRQLLIGRAEDMRD